MSAPADMPVFVIKAKDKLAITAVWYYEQLCVQQGLMEQADEVRKAREEMSGWQISNLDLVQMPDHKHVPVTEGLA